MSNDRQDELTLRLLDMYAHHVRNEELTVEEVIDAVVSSTTLFIALLDCAACRTEIIALLQEQIVPLKRYVGRTNRTDLLHRRSCLHTEEERRVGYS